MNQAEIVVNNNVITKTSAVKGKKPPYWTKNGVTVFYFDREYVPDGYQVIKAFPGMVGTNYRGDALYSIMADGECVEIAKLGDQPAKNIVNLPYIIEYSATTADDK